MRYNVIDKAVGVGLDTVGVGLDIAYVGMRLVEEGIAVGKFVTEIIVDELKQTRVVRKVRDEFRRARDELDYAFQNHLHRMYKCSSGGFTPLASDKGRIDPNFHVLRDEHGSDYVAPWLVSRWPGKEVEVPYLVPPSVDEVLQPFFGLSRYYNQFKGLRTEDPKPQEVAQQDSN